MNYDRKRPRSFDKDSVFEQQIKQPQNERSPKRAKIRPFDKQRKPHSGSRNRDHKKRQVSSSGYSNDDDVNEKHFEAAPGRVLDGRFEVVRQLGKGTFGKVFECKDFKHGDIVAVKAVRRVERYIKSAKIEASILSKVYDEQAKQGVNLCVRMFLHFELEGHYFLVCEPLGFSLYDIVKQNNYKRLPLNIVREVSRQLMLALEFLMSIHLIHTDLKLENVLFVGNQLEEAWVTQDGKRYSVLVPRNPTIKLIDFGGATFDAKAARSSSRSNNNHDGSNSSRSSVSQHYAWRENSNSYASYLPEPTNPPHYSHTHTKTRALPPQQRQQQQDDDAYYYSKPCYSGPYSNALSIHDFSDAYHSHSRVDDRYHSGAAATVAGDRYIRGRRGEEARERRSYVDRADHGLMKQALETGGERRKDSREGGRGRSWHGKDPDSAWHREQLDRERALEIERGIERKRDRGRDRQWQKERRARSERKERKRKIVSAASNHGIINTRQYRGPEVTLDLSWSYPSDMWSVGCIIAEIYCGELLFDTHEELEHLALMERCLGKFPPRLIDQTAKHIRKTYFHSDGYVRVDKLSSKSRSWVKSMQRLEALFTLAPEDEASGIIEFMRGALFLDPDRRMTPREALHSTFLAGAGFRGVVSLSLGGR